MPIGARSQEPSPGIRCGVKGSPPDSRRYVADSGVDGCSLRDGACHALIGTAVAQHPTVKRQNDGVALGLRARPSAWSRCHPRRRRQRRIGC